jgi:hypothetical protein
MLQMPRCIAGRSTPGAILVSDSASNGIGFSKIRAPGTWSGGKYVNEILGGNCSSRLRLVQKAISIIDSIVSIPGNGANADLSAVDSLRVKKCW